MRPSVVRPELWSLGQEEVLPLLPSVSQATGLDSYNAKGIPTSFLIQTGMQTRHSRRRGPSREALWAHGPRRAEGERSYGLGIPSTDIVFFTESPTLRSATMQDLAQTQGEEADGRIGSLEDPLHRKRISRYGDRGARVREGRPENRVETRRGPGNTPSKTSSHPRPDAVVSAYSLAVLDGMAAPSLTRAKGPLKASKLFKEIEYSPECRLRLPAGIL